MAYEPGLDPRPFNQLSPEEQAIRAGQTQPLRELQFQSGDPFAIQRQVQQQTLGVAQSGDQATQILDMLKQYQRGTQRARVGAFEAPLPERLQGLQLSGGQIQGFKTGEQQTYEPTIGGIRSAIEEFQRAQESFEKNQLKEQESLRRALDTAASAGSTALRGLLKTNPKAFKAAGVDAESYIAGIEAMEREEKRRFDVKEAPTPTTGDYKIERASRISADVDAIKPKINARTAGVIGKLSANIPGTPAYDLAREIDTIKANIGFNELQAMREASKTGGALGQVAVQELNFLQSTLGSLDIGQSPAQLKANLDKVKASVERWNAATVQTPQPTTGTIKVRRKSDGKTGVLPANEFNSRLYDKI